MHDDDLYPSERDALDRLPDEMPPPPALEVRVVDALRASGHLAARPAPRTLMPSGPIAQIAAALLLVALGAVFGRLTTAPTVPDEAPPVADGTASDAQFLLLLYGGPEVTPDEEAARVTEYAAWAGRQAEAGRLVSAEKLQRSAIVLGPPPDAGAVTSEPAGFFLIRAASVDEAVAVARECPHLRHGGTVVVRPVDPTN